MEETIKFLVSSITNTGTSAKPVILHSIRVGLCLKEYGYGRDIVLAGILHDVIEDSDMALDELREKFGPDVAELVVCATHDTRIRDKTQRYKEAQERALAAGKDALVIVAADFIDNSVYYRRIENLQPWLRGKMKHFIDISGGILKDEPIYNHLLKAYQDSA